MEAAGTPRLVSSPLHTWDKLVAYRAVLADVQSVFHTADIRTRHRDRQPVRHRARVVRPVHHVPVHPPSVHFRLYLAWLHLPLGAAPADTAL